MKNTAEIAATRITFDGVIVYFHTDGTASTASVYLYGKLPVADMWQVIDNTCTYTFDEVCAILRSRKVPARRIPVPPNADQIMARNSRDRCERTWQRLIYDRSPWRRR